MSMDHEFYLADLNEIAYEEYWKVDKSGGGVLIHDDVLGHILHTIIWIPTYNPSRKEAGFGLNLFGPTVIKAEGASLAQQIFQCWAALLGLGPPVFKVKGNYIFNDEHPDGFYSSVTIHRDELVQKLNQLALYAEQVKDSNGRYFIVHLGI